MVDININKKVDIAAKRMEATGAETTEKAWDTMTKVADNIRNISLDKYKADMMDRVDDAKAHLDTRVDDVKANIQDHPFESVAIAAGAGILVGAFIALAGRRAAKKATRM